MSTPVPNTFQAAPGSDPTIGDQNPNPNAVPTPSPAAFQQGATPGETLYTVAQLEAARKQEKDKLYAQIEALQTKQNEATTALQALQAAKQAELDAAAAAVAEKEAQAKTAREADMSAKALLEQKLAETTQTWEQKFAQIEAERAQERAVLDKERAYQELVVYRNTAISTAGDAIAPQFYDFITGETQAEIDAGIARAKAATESIAAQFAEAQKAQLSQMRGVSTAGYVPVGPMENNPGQQNLSAEDINNMPMSEFAKLRQQTGIGRAESRSNRGLFG
jgi:hypothetical protein